MSASFFRRLSSSFIDLILVLIVVYFAFVVGGRTLIQNRIENFGEIYDSYNDMIALYNEDMSYIRTEYDANMQLANGDAELEVLAQEIYDMKAEILLMQNNIDSRHLNEPLNTYFLESIYFYAIGFVILMTIVATATRGKTPGRWLLKVRLVTDPGNGEFGKPNPFQVFFHDIMLKYFIQMLVFLLIVFTVSLYYGGIFLLMSIAVDLILMSFTKNKSTIRDYFLKLRVIKA